MSPVILLANVPIPVPSVVWLSVISGLADVFQQTPLAVTVAPPSELILPPLIAVVVVIDVTAPVVIVGKLIIAPFSICNSFWQEINKRESRVNKNKLLILLFE